MINTFTFLFIWSVFLYFSFFLEIKLVADFQARMGPSRIGLSGFSSPAAVFSRLLFSSQERGWRRDDVSLLSAAFFLVLSMCTSPLLASESYLKEEIGIPVCLMSFLVSVVFFANVKSKGIFKSLNHAQFLVGALVLVTAILGLGVQNSGMSWTQRGDGAVFQSPLSIFGYFSCLTGGFLVLFERPFLPVGALSSLSGYRKLLFDLYRRSLLLYWIVLSVMVFTGGLQQGIETSEFVYFRDLLFLVVLALVHYVFSLWLSQSQVSLRADQTTRLAVRFLFPLALLVLVFNIVMRFEWI